MLAGLLCGNGLRDLLGLVGGVVGVVGGVVRASARAQGNLGAVGLARVCVGRYGRGWLDLCVGGRHGGGGVGQGGQLVQ